MSFDCIGILFIMDGNLCGFLLFGCTGENVGIKLK